MNCVKRSTTHSELFGPTRSDVTHEDLSLCNEYISSVMSVYLDIEQEVRSDLRWSQDEGQDMFKVVCVN